MVINRVFFICYDYIFFIYNNWNSLLEFNRDREKKINVMNNKLYFQSLFEFFFVKKKVVVEYFDFLFCCCIWVIIIIDDLVFGVFVSLFDFL